MSATTTGVRHVVLGAGGAIEIVNAARIACCGRVQRPGRRVCGTRSGTVAALLKRALEHGDDFALCRAHFPEVKNDGVVLPMQARSARPVFYVANASDGTIVRVNILSAGGFSFDVIAMGFAISGGVPGS